MKSAQTGDLAPEPAPGPGLVDGLDSLAAALRELRVWAGSPSYARIAREVGAVRRRRGVPTREASPGRVTVYDCFRDGRRRIDVDLVVDIAEALGASREDCRLWRLAARGALRPVGRNAPRVASAPSRPPHFTGRERELALLVAPDAPRLHVVRGLSGVGKSALAETAARELLDRGLVDTAVRVALRNEAGDLDPFDAMVSVVRAMDPQAVLPSTPTRQRAAYLEVLAAQRTVMVVDDATSVRDVELLLPTDPRTRVIVTSRWALDWPAGTVQIELAGLDAAESARLLVRAAGRDEDDVDDDDAQELRRMSGGLPLAVSLIGARAARDESWSAGEHLQAYRDRLELLQLEDVVLAALTTTYDGLVADEQRALRLLALHPTPEWSTAAAAALIGLDSADCRRRLDALERAHLLRRSAENRWEMHSLVQVFGERAAVREELPRTRHAARERLLDHYCAHCARAVLATHPTAIADFTWLAASPPPQAADDAVRWLRAERSTLLEAAEWADQHGHHDHFLRLTTMLTRHLWGQGDLGRALSLQRLAVSTAARIGDRQAEATAERCLGMTYVRNSRPGPARAHLERAAALLADSNPGQLPMALNALAVCSLMTGDYQQAINELEEVLATGDEDQRCRAMTNLGVAHTRSGNIERAVAVLEDCAALAEAHGWVERQRTALTNLADAFADSDDPAFSERAVRAATAAKRLALSTGDEVGALYSECNLALAMHRSGETGQGRDRTLAALERTRELDVPELRASVLNNLGDMHSRDGDRAEALSWFGRAHDLATEIDSAFERERAERGLAALDGDSRVTVVSTTRGSSEGPG